MGHVLQGRLGLKTLLADERGADPSTQELLLLALVVVPLFPIAPAGMTLLAEFFALERIIGTSPYF